MEIKWKNSISASEVNRPEDSTVQFELSEVPRPLGADGSRTELLGVFAPATSSESLVECRQEG